MRILFICAIALLSSCATEEPATGEALAKLQQNCQQYGFTAGTPQFAQCIYQLDQQRMSTAYQRRMAVADALGGMSNASYANAAAYQQQAATSRPMTCTTTPHSTFVGGTPSSYSTSCY